MVLIDASQQFFRCPIRWGQDKSAPSKQAAPRPRYATAPFNLAQAARDADIAVTYASSNTSTSFLLAGKPLLLLPNQLEQFLVGRCIEEMGAGLLIHPEQPANDLPEKLNAILTNPAYTDNARAFANKYRNLSQGTITANLIRRIEEILSATTVKVQRRAKRGVVADFVYQFETCLVVVADSPHF